MLLFQLLRPQRYNHELSLPTAMASNRLSYLMLRFNRIGARLQFVRHKYAKNEGVFFKNSFGHARILR
jgi:hypothetical protein